MSDSIMKNRLWNLRRLVKAVGGTNSLADTLGRSPAYITALCGPNPQRNIGDKTATHIENIFEMAPGTLDLDPPREVGNSDPILAEIAETLAYGQDQDKEFILAMSQWIVSRSLDSINKPGKINLSNELDSLNSSSLSTKKPVHIPRADAKIISSKSSKR